MARDPDEPDTLPGSVDDFTRGVDSVLGREVAMISLPPARGEALAVRTEQVRRLAALHHPNLIEVYDVDGLAEDSASTLVLQSVEGHSLAAVVATASWPAVSVAHVGSQVADGLAHAHAHAVVHGGIGPASIVVDESLHAWLTGFTAALRPAPATTPTDDGHVAPAPAADVVALGATLRTLLDTSTPVPSVLDAVLRAMTTGRLDARGAAEALSDAAESCAHGGVTGGVVPMSVHSARISSGRAAGGGAPGPASAPASRSVPLAVCSPDPVPAAAAITVAREPSSAPPPARVAAPARGRTSRLASRGLRVAVLSSATVAVAAASGAVLWVTNSFSSPLDPSRGATRDGATTVVDRAGSGLAPAAPAAPVGDAPDPFLDVTTFTSASDVPAWRGVDPGLFDAAERADDAPPPASDEFTPLAGSSPNPPVAGAPDPPRGPAVPPPAAPTTPRAGTTTTPPSSTTTPTSTTTTSPSTTTSTTTPKSTTTTSTSTSTSASSAGPAVSATRSGNGAGQAGGTADQAGQAAPAAAALAAAPSTGPAGTSTPAARR